MTPASRKCEDHPDHAGGHDSPEAHDPTDCTSRLAAADASLVLTLRASPRSWLAARDYTRDVVFISTYPHPDCHRTFSDPGDTVGIALAVDEWLDALADDATPAVCLAGLDTFVEYASNVETRRFLQVVTGRVRAADGTIHCHDDSDAATAAPPERYLLGDTINRNESG